MHIDRRLIACSAFFALLLCNCVYWQYWEIYSFEDLSNFIGGTQNSITNTGGSSKSWPLAPNCDNILQNMTRGQWVKKIDIPQYQNDLDNLRNEEAKVEEELRLYWVKRGIQTAFWREDLRCGYSNYAAQPSNTKWPKVGSWCGTRGSKPCCSDKFNGICMEPSDRSCNCDGCVDLRKYKYCEVSDWVVADNRCEWENYNAAEICEVIEQSAFSDIQFVGDSFIRNMFKTLAIMITNDFDYGAISSSTPADVRELCAKTQPYYWTYCQRTIMDVSKTTDPGKLCGGRGYLNFTATLKIYYNVDYRVQFLQLVRSKINVPGSVIILGVGLHMQLNSRVVIEKYLGPAIDAITEYYGPPPSRVDPLKLSARWPQVILCSPPTTGLLKPPSFFTSQNDVKCEKYLSQMKVYADKHDVRILDFRGLTKEVYSFDGTHYGLEVNKMKNLLLLNHIASLVP